MVEPVESIREIVDKRTYLMRRQLLKRRLRYFIVFDNLQHQRLLTLIMRALYLKIFKRPAPCLILIQD